MAKSILGDDPFAPSEKKKDEKKKPEVKKKTTRKAKPAKTARARQKPEAPPEPEPPVEEEALLDEEEAATEVDAATVAEEIAPEPEPEARVEEVHAEAAPPAPAADYGPSIDHPPAHAVEPFHPITPGPGERRKLPLEFVWKRWRDIAMRDRSEIVDEFGLDPHVAARMDPLLEFLYRRYFRVETEGMGHLPDEGRALIVANHSGSLPYDGAMIMYAARRDHRTHRAVRPLVEDFVFHFPYLGTLMNRIGGVRACQENAERLLQQEQLVAVFPEGLKGIGKLWSQRYQLQRFGRGGFVKLALATDSPIIPTAVVGAEEIHPMLARVTWLARSVGIPYLPITPTFPWLGPLGLVPLPTKWFIAFGRPLYFNAEYGAGAADDRILVNKLAEQVRQRIQEMIDALLHRRRSVWRG